MIDFIDRRFKGKGEAFVLFLLFFCFYCFFQLKSIYGGDSGDFVAAAWFWGIPHPPGYPFYSLVASILSHFVPFFTPAWRVGLISSSSSALTLAFFYLLLKKIIRRVRMERYANAASLIGTLTLAFLYPFWLYSEVAEAFALNNLFVILLTYLLFSFNGIADFSLRSKRALRLGIAFFFILGLSLTHHHVIVLLFPGLLYLFIKAIKKKTNFRFKKKHLILCLLFLALGLSFYIYPLLACRKTPLFCWDDPVNFKNLVRLITRADYGTFRSGLNLGNAPILRVYALASFFRISLEDFRILGLVLIVLGFYRVYKSYKTNRENYFQFFIITLTCCIFFIFYASFMLVNDFMVATFERFLLLPYIFMSLLLGIGVSFIFEQSEILIKKFNLSSISRKTAIVGLKIIFFILPLSLFTSNFKRISILKNDMTAEDMVKDFLTPLPYGSIFIVSSDTTVFDTQYVRYVLGIRDDVTVVKYPHLPAPFYKKELRKHFPELILSDKSDHKENLDEFIKLNAKNSPVFLDVSKFGSEENWIPYGLTWHYIPMEDRPATASVVKKNIEIWEGFSDPLSGSLGKFKNLFLADVLRIYYDARIDVGEYLFRNDYLEEAKEFFEKANKLKPEYDEAYLGLGAVALKNGNCDIAKEMFLKALEINEKSALALGYLRKNELECFDNEEKAKEFEDQCVGVQDERGTFLEDLGK